MTGPIMAKKLPGHIKRGPDSLSRIFPYIGFRICNCLYINYEPVRFDRLKARFFVDKTLPFYGQKIPTQGEKFKVPLRG